jgi:NitT/TauT family transport system ATP-binding protein
MKLENVDFSYREKSGCTSIFQGLSKIFEPGLIHSIIGGSGCGKTTLLYLLSGLLQPDRGSISIGDCPGKTASAIILQDFGLFPWKKVQDNIALGLRLRGETGSNVKSKTESIMEELGISHLSHVYPSKISGGERQRVAIARAVVLEPSILLMDEPFSSLDAINREHIQDLLIQTHKHHKMTVLLVTHSIEEAAYVSNSINVMKRNEQGKPAVLIPSCEGLIKPESRQSSQFHHTVDTVRSALEKNGEYI